MTQVRTVLLLMVITYLYHFVRSHSLVVDHFDEIPEEEQDSNAVARKGVAGCSLKTQRDLQEKNP